MSKKANLDRPISVVIALMIFALVLAAFLALQHLLNQELVVLYQEIGEITKLTPSFVATTIFMACCLIFLILSHLDRHDVFMEETIFTIFYAALLLIMIGVAIWGGAVAHEGLKTLENTNARLTVTLPCSLFLSVGLYVLYIGLLDKFFHDELNPFLVYLLFPFLVLVISFLMTFFLFKIPIGWLRDLLYYGIAIISFLIGGFFFVVYSAIGDELDIDHEDYEPSSHNSYSGGYSSSYSSNTISDMEYQRIIQDKIADQCYRAYVSGLSGFYNYGSIESVSVEISSGTCNIYARLSLDFTSNTSMREYEAKNRADEISDNAKQVFASIAEEILNDAESLNVSSVTVHVSSSVKYNSDY